MYRQEVQKHSAHTLEFRNLKRTFDMYLNDQLNPVENDEKADKIYMDTMINSEYKSVKAKVEEQKATKLRLIKEPDLTDLGIAKAEDNTASELTVSNGTELMLLPQSEKQINSSMLSIGDQNMLVPRKAPVQVKPVWHAPWKLSRVISGHGGWVRCVDVEPGNEWFVTGSADRIIKIWDMAQGTLKLSLTGHISTVRGVQVSKNHPYLFSCGEDKQVKCWDLEYNKVIRHYHGHLSAVYGMDLHPTIDLLVTCGRDATARIWDMRTKAQVHCLSGHTNTVSQVKCQASEPQVITCSHDSTIRYWDLVAGKTMVTLTNHKKSVRSIAIHPNLNMMASASPDNLKQWKFPDGNFLQNMSGHNCIVNCLATNRDDVLVSGGDNGSMYFWDWKSAYNFQKIQTTIQPGSIASEAGIFAMTFDKGESQLITCEADKTIKIYREDETASEETHPIVWKPEIIRKRF